jgi:snurportin-1
LRQLDLFAGLSLGPSDDEDDELRATDQCGFKGVAPFASLLSSSQPSTPIVTSAVDAVEVKTEGKRKGKRRRRKEGSKPSKWADKCMYAELLEMTEDYDGQSPWSVSDTGGSDGLPMDLEKGFVAVAPVPAGKRCLAVTHQSSGLLGAGSSDWSHE